MSLWAVVRLGRPKSGVDVISMACARDALGPVSPVVAGSSAGDMATDALGLGSDFTFLQRRRRTLGIRRLAMKS